jgi:mitochondrial transcription factor 1
VLVHWMSFCDILTVLCMEPLEKVDSRVKVLPFNGYSWDTYTMLENEGLLDNIPKVSWDSGGVYILLVTHSLTD